jgi:hypothetical protein
MPITKAANYTLPTSQVIAVGVAPDGKPALLNVDADGNLVTGLTFGGSISIGTVAIDQATPNANKVVVISSGLPTGAATQATLASILAALADPPTATLQTSGNSTLSTLNGKVTACNTGAVVVSSSALPSGAATQTTLAALDAKVTAVNTGAVVVASGAITTTPVTLTRANTTAYAASLVVKASAGSLHSISGYNSGPAQFIQVHDAASLPADTAAPCWIIAVPAQASWVFDFGGNAMPCSTGIVISNSSTGPTKTIGSANCWFTALYR